MRQAAPQDWALKKILNPGVLWSIVAVVIFLLELPVPEVIMDVLSSVGGLTITSRYDDCRSKSCNDEY